MGRYPFPASIGTWRLSGAQLAANLSISGYLAGIVNTSHDQLCWNFAYADGVISELSARRYADACVQILLGTFDETTESGGGQWNSGS